MTKTELAEVKGLMEEGNPIRQALCQLNLDDTPRATRIAMVETYGREELTRIIRDKVQPAKRAAQTRRHAVGSAPITRIQYNASLLLDQGRSPAELDKLVAVYFQLIADVRARKQKIVNK